MCVVKATLAVVLVLQQPVQTEKDTFQVKETQTYFNMETNA